MTQRLRFYENSLSLFHIRRLVCIMMHLQKVIDNWKCSWFLVTVLIPSLISNRSLTGEDGLGEEMLEDGQRFWDPGHQDQSPHHRVLQRVRTSYKYIERILFLLKVFSLVKNNKVERRQFSGKSNRMIMELFVSLILCYESRSQIISPIVCLTVPGIRY